MLDPNCCWAQTAQRRRSIPKPSIALSEDVCIKIHQIYRYCTTFYSVSSGILRNTPSRVHTPRYVREDGNALPINILESDKEDKFVFV